MVKYWLIILSCLLLISCGQPVVDTQEQSNVVDASDLTLIDQGASENFKPLDMTEVALAFLHDGIMMVGPIVVDLACDNVYGTATGDWTQSGVSTTSGGTVSVISGKNCRVTLDSYNDGSNTYSPVSSSIVVSVSNTGVVTPVSATQYTSGGGTPVLQWFAASSGGAFSIIFNYAADAVSETTSPTMINLTGQAITLTVSQIPAPTLSALKLYTTPSLNGQSLTYTLTAAVSGSTGCKLIDNSSATYTPTSWGSVNTAYNDVGAITCPQFVDGGVGFSQGNFTSYWQTGVKTLIMWANTVNNLSSYTTANIGP